MTTRLGGNRIRPQLHALEGRDCPAVFTIPTGDEAALNAAIVAANANGVNDTINLAVNGTYTLTGGLGLAGTGFTSITHDRRAGMATVTINGNGSVIERDPQREETFRIFRVEDRGYLKLNDVTVQNGVTREGEKGGAILVATAGKLAVKNALFRGNQANNAGGAIAFDTAEESVIQNSTFAENMNNQTAAAGGGGAIYVEPHAGRVLIVNCTVANNTNRVEFIEDGGGDALPPEVVHYGGGLSGGAFTDLANSILYGNMERRGEAVLVNDLAVPTGIISADNTVVGEYDSKKVAVQGDGNQLDPTTNNPRLGLLANNGGRSNTFALGRGSPAIDAGANKLFPGEKYDQRGPGFARIVGGRIDIGAFEFLPNTHLTLKSSVNPSRLHQLVTFTATVTADGERGVPKGSVKFMIDGQVVATVPLDAQGKAHFSTSTLTRGAHPVVAEFVPDLGGESPFDPSSASLIQKVGDLSRRWER